MSTFSATVSSLSDRFVQSPRRRATLRRVLRCFAVSVGTTVLSLTILVLLAVVGHVPAGTANVIAVCCAIFPSYFLNRRYVWRRTDRHRVVDEVAPFWVLSLLGLAISTIAVARVDVLTQDWSRGLRAVALPAANLSVFALLWIVQFVILDRVIFRDRNSSAVVLPFAADDPQKDQGPNEHRSAVAR
jgi:putative flippase GtrA